MHKILRYPNFSQILKRCPRNFSALWDHHYSTEKRDTPVMHKIFRYPKFSETLKGCPRNILALWDQNFSTENRDTPSSLPPPPPFLSIIFFSIPDFFWYTDQKGSPAKFFSTETKKISTQNCEINLWSIKSFDTRN